MDFAHFKTAAQFGRVGANARLARRLSLYRRLAAKAMAELARERKISADDLLQYHLPGEHDQCDHSITGACSEGDVDYFKGESPKQTADRLLRAKNIEQIPGLIQKFPSSIPLTHDTFKKNVAGILKSGIGTEEEGSFASLGRLNTSGFVMDKARKAVIHIELPTTPLHSRNVIPDMRFSGEAGELLKEFPNLTGADVFYNGKIPAKFITHITDAEGKVLWSKRRGKQFASGYDCAYCGIHRYHLPGQHNPCEHSPTWECSESKSYQQSPAERRVDFAAIKRALDDGQVGVDLALRVPIRKVLDDLIVLIKEQDKRGGITDSFVMGLVLTTGPEAQKILGDYLLKVWKWGRELAVSELPEKIRHGIREYTCDYCKAIHHHEADKCIHFAFCPTGEGGGIDNSCSPTSESGNDETSDMASSQDWLTNAIETSQFPTRQKTGKAVVLQSRIRDVGRFEGRDSIIVDVSLQDVSTLQSSKRLKLLLDNAFDGYKQINAKAHAPDIFRDGVEIDKDFADWLNIKYDKQWKETNLPSLLKKKTAKHLKRFAGLEPVQAINFFQNLRPWLVKGIIDDELKKSARLELTEHLKGGRTLTETIGNLRSAWEPWVGDPTKIIPSGITGTAEDILQAYRLENIVRTEAITALSQGRAEIGDEAGDFVIGYQLSPILDERTSEICNRIGELEELGRPVQYRKDDPRAEKLTPALHWQCRTIPVFVTTDDLPVRWSTEAELDSVLRLVPVGFK